MKPAVCLSVAEFCHAVKTNRIFTALDDAFAAGGRWVAPNERQSWQGSLPRLSGALELASLPDSTYIGLEVQVPYYSRRVDAVLYGHDAAGKPFAVLVELKQWSAAELAGDGRLLIGMRGGPIPHDHPSSQVEGYRQYLGNYVKAFHNEPPSPGPKRRPRREERRPRPCGCPSRPGWEARCRWATRRCKGRSRPCRSPGTRRSRPWCTSRR